MNTPTPMSTRPRGMKRIQPWIGALILALGATQSMAVFMKSGPPDLRLLGTGLLIGGGGLGLIFRAPDSMGRRLAFVGLGIAGAVGLVFGLR